MRNDPAGIVTRQNKFGDNTRDKPQDDPGNNTHLYPQLDHAPRRRAAVTLWEDWDSRQKNARASAVEFERATKDPRQFRLAVGFAQKRRNIVIGDAATDPLVGMGRHEDDL